MPKERVFTEFGASEVAGDEEQPEQDRAQLLTEATPETRDDADTTIPEEAGAAGAISPEEAVGLLVEMLATDPQALTANLRSKLSSVIDPPESVVDPSNLNWRTLLNNPDSPARYKYWKRVYERWKGDDDESAYRLGIRRMLNTYEMPFEELLRLIEGYCWEADRAIEVLLNELFGGAREKAMFMPLPIVQDANDILSLLDIMYRGDGHSELSRKLDQRARFEAFRKLGLALGARHLSQDPVLKGRFESAAHFEDYLLKSISGLIDQGEEYSVVPVWFRCKISEDDGLMDWTLEEPQRSGEWEYAELVRVKLSGEVGPHSASKESITAYCIPGNRYVIEAAARSKKGPRRKQAHEYRSVVDYKSIEKMLLKHVRKGAGRDAIRCTFLTETIWDRNKLNSMLQNAFGSSVTSRRIGKAQNEATVAAYNDDDLIPDIEEIHDERRGQNYFVEVRVGTLGSLSHMSQRHPAGHSNYRQHRSIVPASILFPENLYPEIHDYVDQVRRYHE